MLKRLDSTTWLLGGGGRDGPDGPPKRLCRRAVALVFSTAIYGACVTEPSSVSSVQVSSTIGTLVPVGQLVTLSAEALRSDGTAVPDATFTWRSSDDNAATVNSLGVVTTRSEGLVVITAIENASNANGSLQLDLVDADVDAADNLLTDPFTAALVGALAVGVSADVQNSVDACLEAVRQGNLTLAREELTGLRQRKDAASDPNDRVLLWVLDLFLMRAEMQLGL